MKVGGLILFIALLIFFLFRAKNLGPLALGSPSESRLSEESGSESPPLPPPGLPVGKDLRVRTTSFTSDIWSATCICSNAMGSVGSSLGLMHSLTSLPSLPPLLPLLGSAILSFSVSAGIIN